MDQLIAALNDAGLIAWGNIVLSENQTVGVEKFKEVFGPLGDYDTLVGIDDNGDGTTKGYKRFFDAWLEAGVFEQPSE